MPRMLGGQIDIIFAFLDEWIKVIVLVRSYLLFWRNNPSRNLNSSCQDPCSEVFQEDRLDVLKFS